MYLIFFIFLELCSVFSSFATPIASSSELPHGKNASGGCPLNFEVLRKLSAGAESVAFTEVATECQNLLQAIRILRSECIHEAVANFIFLQMPLRPVGIHFKLWLMKLCLGLILNPPMGFKLNGFLRLV